MITYCKKDANKKQLLSLDSAAKKPFKRRNLLRQRECKNVRKVEEPGNDLDINGVIIIYFVYGN